MIIWLNDTENKRVAMVTDDDDILAIEEICYTFGEHRWIHDSIIDLINNRNNIV